jgi:hypothetical protein
MKYQSGNWARSNPLLGRFDVIMGSDVLYDRGQPQVLAQFIEQHAQPGAEVLIVDPDRGNRPAFNREMSARGYSHSETRIATLPGEGGKYKGRLLKYLRTSAD